MKQSELLKRGSYAAAPTVVLFSDRISPTDKLLYIALLRRLGPVNDHCWPTQAELAAQCKVSVRTVRSSLASLEAAGFIRIKPSGGDGGDHYFFEDPEEVEGTLFPAQQAAQNDPEAPAKVAGVTGKSCRGHRQKLPGSPAKVAGADSIDGITKQITKQQQPPTAGGGGDVVVVEVEEVKDLVAAGVHRPTAIELAAAQPPNRIRDVIADARRQASSGRISRDNVPGRIVSALRQGWPLASAGAAPAVDRATAERRSAEKQAAENEAARNRERTIRTDEGQLAWTEAEELSRLRSLDPGRLAAMTASAIAAAPAFHAKRFAGADVFSNLSLRALVITELRSAEAAGNWGQCA